MTEPTGGTAPLDRDEVQRAAGFTPGGAPATGEPPVIAAGSASPATGPAVSTQAGEGPLASVAKDPVEAVKDPDNRAKLLLAIAALTLLNFLLLIGVLFSLDNDGPAPVTVDGRTCIIRNHDGESRLFCAD